MRDRLARGVAANAVGKVYVALIQIISVPALVGAWGVENFGVWLMMSTIPTYLTLSDFGFSQTATADMTMEVAKGKHESALKTFQSLWCLTAIVGGAIILIAGALLAGASHYAGAAPWIADHAAVLWLLTCYAVVVQGSRVVLTGFHASGHYAIGTAVHDFLCFAQGLLAIVVAMLGGGFFACALVLLCGHLASTALLYAMLRQRVSWIKAGTTHASAGEIKRLLRPAMGAMAIPLSLAINVQGMVLVVGAALSPAAAATFGAVRTISRVSVQMVGIFGRASMPELSAASALGRNDGVSSILRMNIAVLAIILVPGALIFALYGSDIVRLWSGGAIVPETSFVALMAAGMVVHAVWMLATQMLLAVNRHGRAAVMSLLVYVAAIVAAMPAAKLFGLEGVAVVLIIGDALPAIICIWYLLRIFRPSGSGVASSHERPLGRGAGFALGRSTTCDQ